MSKLIRFFLNIFWTVIILMFWPILILMSIFAGDKTSQRIGIWGRIPAKPFWIHSASLGETKVALIFADILRKYDPDCILLFSVITPSGYKYLIDNLPKNAAVRILPIDHPFILRFALKKVNGIRGFFMTETEYWFNLMAYLKKRRIPIYVINGRMSKSTLNLVRFFGRDLIDNIRYFCVTENSVSEKLQELGVSKERFDVFGNLKSSTTQIETVEFPFLNGNKFLVCGSTRPGEEEILIEAFNILKKDFSELIMIIAPRHLRRMPSIEKILDERNLKYNKFSEEKVSDIILVDSIGKLQFIYRKASIAFIGGTLIDFGGHNPLEAALYGKPVIFGPYNSSAIESYNALLKCGGGFSVKNVQEFVEISRDLLSDDEKCQLVGKRAKHALNILSESNKKYHNFARKLLQGDYLTR